MTSRKVESDEMPGSLTLEQLFKLRSIQSVSQQLTQQQAQEYVVELTRQMMIKDNLMKHWMRTH